MEVELTEDQKDGLSARALQAERERRRMEILLAVDLADSELARGEGTVIESKEDADRLCEEIKQEGRRLAANNGLARRSTPWN